ncbi:pyridoxal phosphate-dependent aminotransferase [Rhizobium sp. C4]|uniref:pyridoxal phosphate-dependent aminotransferase n=1 Tax=Rhizobium sp. C4 TaxID=1349800 RepID=UPI001E34C568|nr:pyridoxal phosphate-dependent aminotransferase [Rhizobium sp. C4]MCD2171978.1 pyridoxal phosphate-dependent aminotransferase [Rhizobium sp. C4]
MSSFGRFTPLIQSLPTTIPFIGPEAIERSRGLKVKARIGANENGFGPSPKAIIAMEQAARETWQYADPENYDLRVALAAHLGITANNINVGGGIDELLGLIVRMIVLPDTPVVTSLGGYPTFNFQVAGFGGRLVTVPYKDDQEDLGGLLDAVKRENAPLVYVANPDNPMGSWHKAEDIVAFAKALPETTLLILDEAYGETAPAGVIPSIASLIDLPNVIRTRTFSKAYGMAGSRVGYAISTPENANAFDKIRNHFGMNRIAIAAALAALDDHAYLEETLARIKAARERIADIARANQLSPLPSATNFVAIDTGRDGPYSRAIVDGLMEEGVFIRLPGVAPLNRCIRVSVGPEADLALFEEALPKVLRRLG